MGLSNAGAPTVSEPNLKLRYKPKKSLERRKNPLLRKESAPPSLRRRPAEPLGGKGQQGEQRGPVFSLWVRSHPDRASVHDHIGCVPHTCQGGEWPAPAPLAKLTSAQKKECLQEVSKGTGDWWSTFFLPFWEESGK